MCHFLTPVYTFPTPAISMPTPAANTAEITLQSTILAHEAHKKQPQTHKWRVIWSGVPRMTCVWSTKILICCAACAKRDKIRSTCTWPMFSRAALRKKRKSCSSLCIASADVFVPKAVRAQQGAVEKRKSINYSRVQYFFPYSVRFLDNIFSSVSLCKRAKITYRFSCNAYVQQIVFDHLNYT